MLPMQSGPTSIEKEICLAMVKMEEEKKQQDADAQKERER
jgi:hypothetical protein